MPNIRAQAELSDGFWVDTTDFGKREVRFLSLGGNDWRLWAYIDDVLNHQEDLSNPSLPEIYDWVSTYAFDGAPVQADGKTILMGGLYFSWHKVTNNPLVFRILSGNAPPPDNWWQ